MKESQRLRNEINEKVKELEAVGLTTANRKQSKRKLRVIVETLARYQEAKRTEGDDPS